MQEIKIIQEPTPEKPFVVIYKPENLPSAPLAEHEEENALMKAAQFFPEILNIKGRKAVEHGLLHRLDTETRGLLLIAATQKFYDSMQIEQQEGRFIKTYRANIQKLPNNIELLNGFPPEPLAVRTFEKNKEITVQSYFRNYGPGLKEVRPVTDEAGKAALKKTGSKKLYSTQIKMTGEKTAECRISAGYRHQVRCHLAWCGIPVCGDRLYNSSWKEVEKLEFYATEIEFWNCTTGKIEKYRID